MENIVAVYVKVNALCCVGNKIPKSIPSIRGFSL